MCHHLLRLPYQHPSCDVACYELHEHIYIKYDQEDNIKCDDRWRILLVDPGRLAKS